MRYTRQNIMMENSFLGILWCVVIMFGAPPAPCDDKRNSDYSRKSIGS
jgi:hypothetical protein